MGPDRQQEREIRLLVVHGSPRRGANTDILVDRMVNGVRGAGAKVEHLYASRLRISPCIGCGGCEKEGLCVIDDNMQAVYPALEKAHRVVLATPVYFYGVTAQLKALIDRCQAFWSRKYLLNDPLPTHLDGIERRGYLISVAATTGHRIFEGVVLTARTFFDALNMAFEGKLLVRGVDHRGAVLEREEALKEALEMGVSLGGDR